MCRIGSLGIAIGCALVLAGRVMADEPQGRDIQHVVLVSVDGLSGSYLQDPRAELPVLRSLARDGAMAEGMLTTFPSVTWPSHVSLITGTTPAQHGVVGNVAWDRQRNRRVQYIGDPELTRDEAIRVPTLYDAADQAGLSTASVIWPCSNGADSLRWMIPDSNQEALHARYTTPGLAEELAEAGIDISPLGSWGWDKARSTDRDLLYTRVARHLLREHQVNLLLVHLITPDGVQHRYGPNTPPAFEAVAESDQRIGEIWEVLQSPPFAGRSALLVVSDHGFAPYDKFIQPNAALAQLGLVKVDERGQITGRQAWCLAQGGSAFVYVLDETREEEIVQQLSDEFSGMDGVLEVLQPEQFTQLGLPAPEESPEAPHLVLTTGPGYSFSNSATGEAVIDAGGSKGSHGHDPRPPYMHATFVAAGAGIRSGVKLEQVRNLDVAPTIARLLGVDLPTAQGRVLEEILAD